MDKPSIAHGELVAARLKRVAGLRESQRELPRQPEYANGGPRRL